MNQKSRMLCWLCSPALLAGWAQAQPIADAPMGQVAPAYLARPAPEPDDAATHGLRGVIDQQARPGAERQDAPAWRLNPQQRAELREQLRAQSRAQSRELAPTRRASATVRP